MFGKAVVIAGILASVFFVLVATAPGQSSSQAEGAAGTGAATTGPALSAHDLELLHELETGDWHTRKNAEAELADRDPADAPILQEMLARAANPEARARLKQALATMSSNRALGPSRITLHLKDASAQQVYAEIFRQARAQLRPASDDLFTHPAVAPISIDVDRVPFWTVMEQLYPKTGLMLAQIGPNDFQLARTDPIPPGPRITEGPILIVATALQAAVSEAIEPPNPANPAAAMMLRHRQPRIAFGLVMTAYVEPRIKVLRMTPMVLLDQATDDNGNSLISGYWARFGGNQMPESGPGWPQVVARLAYPDSKPGKRITILRGSVTFDLLLETGHLDIPSPLGADPSAFTINDKPVNFVFCKKIGADYLVQFTTSPGKDDPWDMDVFESQQYMRLTDSAGHDLINAGPAPEQPRKLNGQPNPWAPVEHTILFKPATLPGGAQTGEPGKLLWSYPAKTHLIIVPIEFRDLDMNFQGR